MKYPWSLARKIARVPVKINRRQINFEMIARRVSAYLDRTRPALYPSRAALRVSDARQMVMF